MQPDQEHPNIRELREAVERACQPTRACLIIEGRELVSKLPRHWVLAEIEQVGRGCLNLADYWEYGRFLELLECVEGTELIRKLLAEGLDSPEPDVRDMAEIWYGRGLLAAE